MTRFAPLPENMETYPVRRPSPIAPIATIIATPTAMPPSLGYRAQKFVRRHRVAVAVLSLGVILAAIPLYGLIRQDYLPANADEGEFFVSASAPQGTSLARMDETLRAIEQEIRALAHAYGATFVVNDRVEVALAAEAELTSTPTAFTSSSSIRCSAGERRRWRS